MLYQSVEQGARCQRLAGQLASARAQMRQWENHDARLQADLDSEKRLLENLRQQVGRTGDVEGFAFDIRRSENRIVTLQRNIESNRQKILDQQSEISELTGEMHLAGCH